MPVHPAFLRLLLLSLLLAGCSTPAPQVLVVQTATPSLGSHHSFEMLPPSTSTEGQLPPTSDYAHVEASLRQGLLNHGYRESKKAEVRVAYALTLNETPLEFRVDNPPNNPLGSYLAVHRFQDESATLRLRVSDRADKTLWQGLITTSLSPSWQRDELLRAAVVSLLQQIPVSR
ncbi:hypothetical protein ACVW0Y_002733 [Pseudomonas sp. TE3786]